MPFTRSRTKSPSNGVASNIPASNAPRFFPPSHFAAARSPSRTEEQGSHPARQMIPPSTLPHLPASPSTSSGDAAGASSRLGQITRKLSLTRSGASGGQSAPKSAVKRRASKNEHLKGKMPELEANLLPSLRDTIDRMTQAPLPAPGTHTPSQMPAPRGHDHPSVGARYLPQPSQTSPQRPFPTRDGSRLPTPKSGRLPVLKSALKTPTTPSAITSPHRSPGKTTRFDRDAGPTGRGPSAIPLRQAPMNASSSNFSEHRRHRTDPGASTLAAGSRIPARALKTPQPSSRAPPSHIPGLSTDESTSGWEWGAAPQRRLVVANATVEPSSSGSDYDAYGRSYSHQHPPPQPEYTHMLRRLRTTDDRDSPTPHTRQRTEPRQSVGLGLDVRVPESDMRAYHTGSIPGRYEALNAAHEEAYLGTSHEHRQQDSRRHMGSQVVAHNTDEDTESAYDDSDIEVDLQPSTMRRDAATISPRHASQSAPRSPSVGSPSARSRNMSPVDDSRRERALSGIVDVLERNATFNRFRREDASGESDEASSEYGGQPGLAVSEAWDLDDRRPGDMRVAFDGRESVAAEDDYYYQDNRLPYLERNIDKTPTQPFVTSHNTSSTSRRTSRAPAASPRPAAPRRHASDTSIQSASYPAHPAPQRENALRRWPPPPTHPRNAVASPKLQHSETYDFHDRIRREEAASKAAFGIADSPPPTIRPTESATTINSDRWDEEDHAEGLSVGVESIFGQMDELRADSPEARSSRNVRKYRQDDLRSQKHYGAVDTKETTWGNSMANHATRPWTEEDYERGPGTTSMKSSRAPSPPVLPPRRPPSRSHSRHDSRVPPSYQDSPQDVSPPRSARFSSSPARPPRSPNRARANTMPSQHSSGSLPMTTSAQSLYSEGASEPGDGPGTPTMLPLEDGRTWRETLSSTEFASLLKRYGEVEIARQEAIWGMHMSEQAFTSACQRAIRLFVRPLRAQDSRVWLPGMPAGIARLLDWFEDIAHAHAQLAAALHTAREAQHPIVLRIAETLRAAMPRLEVHQPYLVRIEEVLREIKISREDRRSDFGQFLRLQENTDEARGWTLDHFLLEPVRRLEGYAECFRRLRELTPRDHADHLSTFALLHSTQLLVRVMFEVRARENEYDLVHDILSQIQGLPISLDIASRERRLLARGRLLRHHRGDSDADSLSRAKSHVFGSALMRARMAEKEPRAFDSHYARRYRAGSNNSTDSSALSPLSPFTATSSLSDTPASTEDYDISDSRRLDDDHYTRPRSTLMHLRAQAPSATSTLHVFVFTDLVLLCSTVRPADAHSSHIWRLLDDIGVSRVLGVQREGDALALDLLPVDADDLKTGLDPETAPVAAVTLTVPTTSPSGEPLDVQEATLRWATALEVCAQHTVRALSLPIGLTLGLNSHSDAHSVMAILSSGLPLPKSPSVQLNDIGRGRGGDAVQQEREERGWWSFRFQSVLHETLGRQNAAANGVWRPSMDLGVLASAEVSGSRRQDFAPRAGSRSLRETSTSSTDSSAPAPFNFNR